MAQDIIEMDAEQMTCPHCSKPVLMKWQMAYYELGQGSPQFIGLERATSAEALRIKTSPKRTIKTPPKPRPPRISFLARRGEEPPRRVSFTIGSPSKRRGK